MVDDKAVGRNDHGHHKDGNHHFPNAREIPLCTGQLVVEGDHADIEAVQNDTGHGIHGGVLTELDIAIARSLGVKQSRQQDKAKHFDQPPSTVACEEVAEIGLDKHVDKLEHEVGHQNEGRRLSKAQNNSIAFAQMCFVHVRMRTLMGKESFHNDHGRAGSHGADEEEHGYEG